MKAALGYMGILAAVFSASGSRADYYGSYYPHSYSHDYEDSSSSPIISLTLDAQESRNSSFRIAAREDRLDDMKIFLKTGAQIDSTSDHGETALIYAAENCAEDVVSFLVKSGANPNLQDDLGRTALMLAARDGCLPVARILIHSHRTRLSIRDRDGKSAKDYAVDAGSLDIDGPAQKIVDLIDDRETLKVPVRPRRHHRIATKSSEPEIPIAR